MNFIKLCRLYDSVVSCRIKLKSERLRVKKWLQDDHAKGKIIKCFPDHLPEFIIYCSRFPRLTDYFKASDQGLPNKT